MPHFFASHQQSLPSSLLRLPKSALLGDFRITVQYDEADPAMNVLTLYYVLITFVYRFSAFDFRQLWPRTPFQVPGYNVGILLLPPPQSTLVQNRWVLWGAATVAHRISRDRKFKPISSTLWFQSEEVGRIGIAQDITQLGGTMPGNATVQDISDFDDTNTNGTFSGELASLDIPGFNVKYLFDEDHTLPSLGIFNTAMEGMVAAAQSDLEKRCPRFIIVSTDFGGLVAFYLNGDVDPRGNIKMKYSHIRKAIKGTAFAMIQQRKFKEMTVALFLDGERIAEGKWTATLPESRQPAAAIETS
ncbi:MAG: hypothetical protein Q9219_005650 [cf. Caloplaca sp. 3 TL-2023]